MKSMTRKLKPVEKPEQWASGLDAFRERHRLSHRKLAAACSLAGEFISKSSMERLCNGKAEPRFVERIRPAIRASLRIYLETLETPPDQIDLELRTIFCRPEIEAMITERRELPSEAIEFFGLQCDPFDPLNPRVLDEVFTTKLLDKVAKQVEEAVRYQKFVAIIGDIGSGKTILKKRTVETVRRSNGKLRVYWPDFFNMDRVNSGSIAYWLLRQLGQERVPQDLISRAGALKNVLATLSDGGVRIALGFDECHRLDKRLIVALKNFWELGNGGFDRFLGVVLFGQESFKLVLSEHREIAERCQIIEMPKLDKSEPVEYLRHRVSLAGGKLEKLFEPTAINRIVALANTPLGLGNVANAGLLEAFKFSKRTVLPEFIPERSPDPAVRGVRPTAR